jgi:hypothetical protein
VYHIIYKIEIKINKYYYKSKMQSKSNYESYTSDSSGEFDSNESESDNEDYSWESSEDTEKSRMLQNMISVRRETFLHADEIDEMLTTSGQLIVPLDDVSSHQIFIVKRDDDMETKRKERINQRKLWLEALSKENAVKKEQEEQEEAKERATLKDVSNITKEPCMNTLFTGKCKFSGICCFNHTTACINAKKLELTKIRGVVVKDSQITLTDKYVKNLLAPFGVITRVSSPNDKIAFVTFEKDESALKAVASLRNSNNQFIDFNMTDFNNPGKGGKGDQSGKGGKGNQSGKGGKGNQSTKGGKGNQSDKGGKGNQSTKGGKGNQSTKGGKGNQSTKGGKGKSKPCTNFANGYCRFGKQCHYSHE